MVYDYLGTVDTAATEQPTASPIFAEPAALSSLPPALVIVGDEVVVLEDSTRWAEALDAAGVAVGLEVARGVAPAVVPGLVDRPRPAVVEVQVPLPPAPLGGERGLRCCAGLGGGLT